MYIKTECMSNCIYIFYSIHMLQFFKCCSLYEAPIIIKKEHTQQYSCFITVISKFVQYVFCFMLLYCKHIRMLI